MNLNNPYVTTPIKKQWLRWYLGSLEVNDSPRGWTSYKRHPLAIPNHPMSCSDGFSTMQRLLKLGYTFAQTETGFGD